jgi:hypothetical protein
MVHQRKELPMKTRLLGSCLLATGMIVASWTVDAQSTNTPLHFPLQGFSIAALEETPGTAQQQALMMFLPSAHGFQANVNVLIQPYAGTMDNYVAATLEQMSKSGFKLLQKTVADKTAVFEYTGEMQGLTLHWYVRVEKSGARIYVATATATDQQWEKVAARLKACVDSFRCDTGQQSATSIRR